MQCCQHVEPHHNHNFLGLHTLPGHHNITSRCRVQTIRHISTPDIEKCHHLSLWQRITPMLRLHSSFFIQFPPRQHARKLCVI
eukprot:scaffold183677_cov20-Prasinocladus_malaysianus.AAC.1